MKMNMNGHVSACFSMFNICFDIKRLKGINLGENTAFLGIS